jgi:hypothetical protein
VRILMIVAALAVVGDLRAQPPVVKPDPAMQRLVGLLGNDDYQTRDRAAQALRAAGAKALPALRQAVENDDPEVRRQVNDLLVEIETGLLLAPKRVTLKVVNKPLQEIMQDLATQTGYKVECNSANPAQRFSFDLADASFWEAIDRICRECGCTLQQTYGDMTVRLQHVDGFAPHVSRDGAFRFFATGFQQLRQVDLSVARKTPTPVVHNETLTFQFTVCSEPKLPILGMGEVKLLAAYDSEHNSMLPRTTAPIEELPPGPRAMMRGRWTSGRYGSNRAVMQQTQVELVRTSDKASSVKLVRGTIPVHLLADQKPVVVAEKIMDAKGKKAKFGTISISIDDVQVMDNKQVQVKMTVAADDHGNDYSWTNTLYQRFELQDDKGNKYFNHGSGWSSSSPAAVQMTLNFGGLPNAQAPGKLVFQSWTTIQHQINFEFKDLPLP